MACVFSAAFGLLWWAGGGCGGVVSQSFAWRLDQECVMLSRFRPRFCALSPGFLGDFLTDSGGVAEANRSVDLSYYWR